MVDLSTINHNLLIELVLLNGVRFLSVVTETINGYYVSYAN